MYPLTLAFAIENKLLWDEVEGCLADLPVKVVLRQSELGELGVLLERLERTRPNVILLDISKVLCSEDIQAVVASNRSKTVPGWLEVDWDNLKGRVVAVPKRQDVTLPVEEHLVVELYSK